MGNDAPENESENSASQSFEHAHELTACVFEHYMKHHEVVLKKIKHARTATHQSLQEIHEEKNGDKDLKELLDIKKYDEFWHLIIKLLKESGISEEGLQKIENVLLSIPKTIKKHYDILISKDKTLLLLIKELTAEKYKKAYEIINNIQAKPNLMSRNNSEEYTPVDTTPEYILKQISMLPQTQE